MEISNHAGTRHCFIMIHNSPSASGQGRAGQGRADWNTITAAAAVVRLELHYDACGMSIECSMTLVSHICSELVLLCTTENILQHFPVFVCSAIITIINNKKNLLHISNRSLICR